MIFLLDLKNVCKCLVKKGDRIAQLICERIAYPRLEECQVSLVTTKF
jgi:dUTPase